MAAKTLTARLDKRSADELAKLSKALGLTESEIVRQGIRLMIATQPLKFTEKSRFVGVGEFASSQSDLASNKKHLKDFGK